MTQGPLERFKFFERAALLNLEGQVWWIGAGGCGKGTIDESAAAQAVSGDFFRPKADRKTIFERGLTREEVVVRGR